MEPSAAFLTLKEGALQYKGTLCTSRNVLVLLGLDQSCCLMLRNCVGLVHAEERVNWSYLKDRSSSRWMLFCIFRQLNTFIKLTACLSEKWLTAETQS